MTALALFLSTLVLVFTLGMQSQFVNNGHYIAAFCNSLAIGASNLVLFRLAPDAAGIEVAAYLKENGSASAHELADEADIDRACQVSAVLKTHIRRGQVELFRGRYSLNEQYEADLQQELAQAAALLRRHGYRVEAAA